MVDLVKLSSKFIIHVTNLCDPSRMIAFIDQVFNPGQIMHKIDIRFIGSLLVRLDKLQALFKEESRE